MAQAMKKVECDSPCNFSVKSHDEKEIIEIVKQHAKKMHNMTITDNDVKGKMKPA
jgi:predicted small metal-binding protein